MLQLFSSTQKIDVFFSYVKVSLSNQKLFNVEGEMNRRKKGYCPYPCPECGENLESQPGAVIFWQVLPERAVAHIEPGEKGGVIVVLDGADEAPIIELQCYFCGANIPFEVEDVAISPEFEFNEEDEVGDQEE